MIDVGDLALWVALSFAVWSVIASAAALIFDRSELAQSGVRGLIAGAASLAIAAIVLWAALLARDFSVRYVATVTSDALPARYAFAAFWGGRTGALFLLALLIAVAVAVAGNRDARSGDERTASAAVGGFILSGLIALLAFDAAPFARIEWSVRDGLGLNPTLQHPAMLVHPPLLALGAAFTVPVLSEILAGAVTASWSERQTRSVRGWMLLAWLALGAAILSGMWWAHRSGVESGWLRDPLGHGAIWPWLLLTAALAMPRIEARRGRASRTWLTLAATAALIALPLAMVTWNGVSSGWWRVVRSAGGWMLVLGVLLGIGLVAAAITMRVPPAEESVGRGPAARPALALVAAGIVSFALASGGTLLRSGTDIDLAPGGATSVTDPFGREWRFASQGLSRYDVGNRRITVVPLAATLGGRPRGLLASEQQYFLERDGESRYAPVTQPAIRAGPLQDVMVLLRGIERESGSFRIEFQPFVRWAWIGGLLILAGGALLFRPTPETRGS